MKKLLTLLLLCSSLFVIGQNVPDAINYQSVLRNSNGSAVPNQNVSIRFSILQGSVLGTFVFQEEHSITTSDIGLINLKIGEGLSTLNSLSSINWSFGPYFLEIEVDTTSTGNYISYGTSELSSVPYSLHSMSSAVTDSLSPMALSSLPQFSLTEAQVDSMVANNGYLTTEVDSSITNEIQDLVLSSNNLSITNNTSATTVDLSGYLDNTDTVLTEAQVDSMVANNGYLTTEVDSSITNEIQILSISNDTIFLSGGGFAKLPAAQVPPGADGNSSLWQTLNQTNFNGSIMSGGGGSGRFHLVQNLTSWGTAGQSTHQLTIHKMTNQPTPTDYTDWLTFIDPYDIITIRVQDSPERVMHFTVLPLGTNAQAPPNTGPYTGTFQSDDLFFLRLRVINYAPPSANANPMNPPAFDINNPCYISYVKSGPDGTDGATALRGLDGNSALWEWGGETDFNNPTVGQFRMEDATAGGFGGGNLFINTTDWLNSVSTPQVTNAMKDWLLNIEINDILVIRNYNNYDQFVIYKISNITPVILSNNGIAETVEIEIAIPPDFLAGKGANGLITPLGSWDAVGSFYTIGYVKSGPVGAPGADGIDGADGASYTQPTYNIGDIVNGGVVFWLDSTGQHGLVVAFSDVATYVEWGCFGADLPNVPNVPYNGGNPLGLGAEIGDGFNNTNNILKDCPTAPAALAARSYGPDWFLPSAKELNQIYINKTTLEGVNGFNGFNGNGFNKVYWSSSEFSSNNAWGQNFANGSQSDNSKTNAYNVRAVRAF